MNVGDVKVHEGTVIEAGHDMTISAQVDSIADTPLPDIGPEAVSPVRWRPAEGQAVRIYERVGPTYTWAGLAPATGDPTIVRGEMDAGNVCIIGEDGVTWICLEDDGDMIPMPDGLTFSNGSQIRLVRPDATEPLVLGGVWRTKLRAILDVLIQLSNSFGAVSTTLQNANSWNVPALGLSDSAPAPVTGAATLTPPVADIDDFVAGTAAATAASNALTLLKVQLDEALSLASFTAREPTS